MFCFTIRDVLWLATASALIVDGSYSLAHSAEPKPKVDFGFDFASVPPPDKDRMPVARVFQKYIDKKELGADAVRLDDDGVSKLRGIILRSLLDRFAEKHKLTVRDDEVEVFLKSFPLRAQLNPPEFPNEVDDEKNGRKEVANTIIKRWKTDRALYDLYGGVVIFQQGNPFEPVGAYRAFLEEMEQSKVFEIYNDINRERFWHYFTREQSFVVPAERVDYSAPWWTKKAAK